MGYTNYWLQKKPFSDPQWKAIKAEYLYLIEQNKVTKLFVDQTEDIDNDIVLNGVSQYEPFYLSKKIKEPRYEGDNVAFNFCKTAYLPYDLIVWHLLVFAKAVAPGSITISRDRNEPDLHNLLGE
tara:strand:+ start:2527 stop:2901 length:375 start_codon:yes stop_codon:yes gene_type:complete